MRGCVTAMAVLCAVLLLVAANAVYVHHVSRTLLDDLAALPDVPDPQATPAAIQAIHDRLDRNLTGLSLSVNYSLPDRIGENLAALASYAETGDSRQYAATLAMLQDLCRDLARAERFHAENIF